MAPLITKMTFSLQSINKFMAFSFFLSLFYLFTYLVKSTMPRMKNKGRGWAAGCLGPAQGSYTSRALQPHTGVSWARRCPKSRAGEGTGQACSYLFISTYNF